MGQPVLTLIQEVETRWNSTFNMPETLFHEREPVVAALAGLNTVFAPYSSQHLNIISDLLKVLALFNDATIELSEEKRVSGSKVIPMPAMLHHALEEEKINVGTPQGTGLVGCPKKQLKEKHFNCKSQVFCFFSLGTILDASFKKLGFIVHKKLLRQKRQLHHYHLKFQSQTPLCDCIWYMNI